MSDLFRRRGVFSSSDIGEVRRAYRELARRCRPKRDHHGATDHLSSSHRAFEVWIEGSRTQPDADRGGPRRGLWPARAFDEEVDVGFPAVSNLVSRMLTAFFGVVSERPLLVEVHLTRRQADVGARVPLDVSLPHTCPVCGGRGEVWPDPCGACSGSGTGLLPHHFQLVVPPGVRHGTCLRFDVTPPYSSTTRVQARVFIQ